MPSLIILRFKNGEKSKNIVEKITKSSNPAPQKKSFQITERHILIAKSCQMKPLQNSSKARHSYFTGSLKQQEPYKNQLKNMLKSSNSEVDKLQQNIKTLKK